MKSGSNASAFARTALLGLGFRPFFLCGAGFSVVAVSLWLWMTRFDGYPLGIAVLLPVTWHAHEMIYGYAIAVVAGFLLTAVRNWTGVPTVHGVTLVLLVSLWALARMMPFVPLPGALYVMGMLDIGFDIALCAAVLYPIVKAGQPRHLGIWLQLVLLTLGNVFFYLGLLNLLDSGVQVGIYAGLYGVISLMLVVARRVLPMFIENGVGYPVTLTNRSWVDISCVVLMLVFIIAEVFLLQSGVAAVCAGALFVLHALRLAGWYTAGIWKNPLLWILYLAYGWITLGFAMTVGSHVFGTSPKLAIHAFAYGGIGLMTLGMMARVTLGHTGRDIARPPAVLRWSFAALLAGSLARIVMPMIAPHSYPDWITGAQVLWLLAFIAFLAVYAPMLAGPRIDGRADQ
ncbi:MAG: uncharacterized protein involved in response to NO [Gammaproteobacteria bacterium]|nr:MAG: uncharacterized protein involved in response to NO [Gammaproteobacteria bacterium]TND01760.1 MAG: hypothetical protein FD120_2524 [Gammaproteobacteria bacterium]